MGSLQDTTSFLLSQCAFQPAGTTAPKPYLRTTEPAGNLGEQQNSPTGSNTSPAQSHFSKEVQDLKSLLSRVRSGTFAKRSDEGDLENSAKPATATKPWTGLGRKLLHDLKAILGLSGALLESPKTSVAAASSNHNDNAIVLLKEGEVAIIQENEFLLLSFPDISDLLKPL